LEVARAEFLTIRVTIRVTARHDSRCRRDGAVGLLGALAAKEMGAERITAVSRHEARQQLALKFDATDIVTERGDEGVAAIKALTDGLASHSVIEAVGHPRNR
jgi:threonine dehydrogenase-like Zn-dependent dehydrogenase